MSPTLSEFLDKFENVAGETHDGRKIIVGQFFIGGNSGNFNVTTIANLVPEEVPLDFFGRYDLSFSSVYNDDLQYVCHACTRLWQGLTILRVCNVEVL